MLTRTRKPNRLRRRSQLVDYRRRLRWALIQAAARFLKSNPEWADYFFDMRFLLNRGLPLVERHIAGATSSAAIDLALAWAEEWPSLNTSQRKVCLQALTVVVAKLLRHVSETMGLPHPLVHNATQGQDKYWRGVGMPLAYVQAHNPPRRDGTHLQRIAAGEQD